MIRPTLTKPDLSRTAKNGEHTPGGRIAEMSVDTVATEPSSAETPGWEGSAAIPDDKALLTENLQLKQQLADTERVVTELKDEAERALLEQQREYEGMLEQKSELIRELHLKNQELQEKLKEQEERPTTPRPIPREEEVLALSEELERERRQLKEDEEALMEQMSQMEVQMSRERAEMARQRTEMLRLQQEIRHELELAARDAALRERLAPLQRRHQELTRKNNATQGTAADGAGSHESPAGKDGRKESGIFRRLFG
jgi:hypothetical protein